MRTRSSSEFRVPSSELSEPKIRASLPSKERTIVPFTLQAPSDWNARLLREEGCSSDALTTPHSALRTPHSHAFTVCGALPRRRYDRAPHSRAFTLLELLVVLTVIGILSAMALPHIKGLTHSNVVGAANEQLLGDLALARQRAINSRSSVYVVFMPPVNPADFKFLSTTQLNQVLAEQYTGYTLFADRSVGDQPGRPFKRYLTGWKTLPDGVFISSNKFSITNFITINGVTKEVRPFDYGDFPYPTSDDVNVANFPYIKFDSQGKLSSPTAPDGTCIIPLARGSIFLYTDPGTGIIQTSPPRESPPNNSTDTNTYNHIEIDGISGRAHVDRRVL